MTTQSDIKALPQRLSSPQLINMVIGGKTPVTHIEDLRAMGYALILYANAALQGAVAGMQNALMHLRSDGRLDEDPSRVASFAERQRLVDKPTWDALEQKYT